MVVDVHIKPELSGWTDRIFARGQFHNIDDDRTNVLILGALSKMLIISVISDVFCMNLGCDSNNMVVVLYQFS